MDSISPTYEEDPPHSALTFRRTTGRRTSSFSSPSTSSDSFRSSSFSYSGEFPPFSPLTPLKFKGVPFSWEQLPGIPKHQGRRLSKKDSSAHLLPLPPAAASAAKEEVSPKKSNRFQRDHDPFFAALVECSKDNANDHDHEHTSDSGNVLKGMSKIRTLSDRFGLINMYASCKRTCAVSESIVYLPRQSSHYLLSRRSS